MFTEGQLVGSAVGGTDDTWNRQVELGGKLEVALVVGGEPP